RPPPAPPPPPPRGLAPHHHPPDPRVEPVPPPARAQPSHLVPLGRRGVRPRRRRGETGAPQRRLLDLPLVPCDGGGGLRERGDRDLPQPALHRHQGGSRGPA